MSEENALLPEDLEDGEIESDHEQDDSAAPALEQSAVEPPPVIQTKPEKNHSREKHSKKDEDRSERKKSSKEHKKSKEHRSEKHKEKLPSMGVNTAAIGVVDDDFAGNIEKAIRKELKKRNDGNPINSNVHENDSGVEDSDSKKRHKKRKRHDQSEKEGTSRKKRKTESDEEVDEDEMMCVRGASPVHKQQNIREEKEYSDDDYDSSYSNDSEKRDYGRDKSHRSNFRGGRGMSRNTRTDRFKNKFERHRVDRHPLQDPDGICLFYMQGKCYKGDDCAYSHDAQPPRKMELCKFYLNDCCAKRDKCLYLHSDFPCKFYHTGLPCFAKDNCKFAHGKPLSEEFKTILLKHIESAPKEILGEFPRLNRDSAMIMVTNTQNRLIQQYPNSKPDKSKKRSLSPNDRYNNKNDENSQMHDNYQFGNNDSSDRGFNSEKNRKNKGRQSRWNNSSPPPPLNSAQAQGILSIQNLNGVLTSKQISDLTNLGINDITQLTQLTVIQLNQLGISFNQINEIQLNTMNIQKLGLIDSNAELNPNILIQKIKSNQDLDMRVSPGLPPVSTIPQKQSDPIGGDVDMRFQSNQSDLTSDKENSSNARKNKDSLDIDQYTKDALKFSAIENVDSFNDDTKKDMDVDHRVLNYVRDAASINLNNEELKMKNEDTDIRMNMMQSKQFLGKKEVKARRPTTDDEDDTLHIDEKWYSSDEDQIEKFKKIKSPSKNDESKAVMPDTSTVMKNLGDLSKIDISEEVTKLLSTIKESTPSESTSEVKKDYLKSRDPRHLPKPAASENKEVDTKKSSHKPEFVSIYDCVENSSDAVQHRADVDLRTQKDMDLRMPSFGDTDLRQTPGGSDIDLRLGLPLKLMSNYTPAVEVDGSYDSHAPITYKLYAIDIPRPDYTGIKNSTPKSQANNDPRLRKIFRLSVDEPPSVTNIEPPAKTVAPAVTAAPVRSDPRKRNVENVDKVAPSKPAPLEIPILIQTSEWYKDLSSNHKISVNQQLAMVTSKLKVYHQNKMAGSKFDLSEIKANSFLCMIFNKLGIFLDEQGEFNHVNVQDNMPPNMQSMNFNPNNDMFMGNVGQQHMDNMNMMMGMNNMGPNNMGFMGSMNNFDPRYSMGDPRSAPGILGVPPTMNPNFDNMMGMPNYNNSDNYNMNYDGFNGPPNNGNDYMNDDMDDDYYRDCKNDYKNNYRGGRNNDRWNRGRSRGGSGSGGRDRRGYTERSGWKNDRH